MTESVAEEIRTLQSLVWSERDPEGRGFASLADAHRRAGEPRKAFEVLNEGLVRLPGFASGHVVAARLYVEQGLYAEGELAARRALELDPDNVSAMASLVKALEGAGRSDGAADARAMLTALEPEVLLEEGLQPGDRSGDLEPEPAEELVVDIAALEPELPDDALVLDIAALEPELDDDVLDVTALEPSLDDDVLDVTVLEPEPEDDLVLDVRTLAPQGMAPLEQPEPDLPEEELTLAVEEPILDVAALQPDAAEDEPVLEMADLSPDLPEEELVLDVAALEPDLPEEEPVLDVGALEPDLPEEELVLDVGALEPDLPEEELVLEGAALESALPDPPAAARDVPAWTNAGGADRGGGAPRIYTRTLGELYAKQGFTDRAVEVFRQLLAQDPDDAALAARLDELARATPRQAELDTGTSADFVESATGPAAGATSDSGPAAAADAQPRPERDEELEALARDLTMNRDVHPDFDSPFAWADDAEDDEPGAVDEGPTVREYFGDLLSWRSGREA